MGQRARVAAVYPTYLSSWAAQGRGLSRQGQAITPRTCNEAETKKNLTEPRLLIPFWDLRVKEMGKQMFRHGLLVALNISFNSIFCTDAYFRAGLQFVTDK